MRKKLLIDCRYADIAEQKWGSEFAIIPSLQLNHLSGPVSCHPDLSLCKIGNTYIAEKTVYEYYKQKLSESRVICGETVLGSHYPFDVAYNVLISGKTAFANFQYTDRVVKQELKKQNFKLININQGYANCAAAELAGGIITADPSLLGACAKEHIDALKIPPGDVVLPGYDYGFIGGASGFAHGRLLFFGDISKHRSFHDIKRFAKMKGVELKDMKDFPLTDVGTIIGIDGKQNADNNFG